MPDAADTPLVRRGRAIGSDTTFRGDPIMRIKLAGGVPMRADEMDREYLLLPLTPEGEWPEALVERVAQAIIASKPRDYGYDTEHTARAALRALGETTPGAPPEPTP